MTHYLLNSTNITLLICMTALYLIKLICSDKLTFFISPALFIYFAGVGIFIHLMASTPVIEGTLISKQCLDNIIFIVISSLIFHLAANFVESLIINKEGNDIESMKEKDALSVKINKLENEMMNLHEIYSRQQEDINNLHANLQKLSDRTADMLAKLYEKNSK